MSERTQKTVRIKRPAPTVAAVIADLDNYQVWASLITRSVVLSRDPQGQPVIAKLAMQAGGLSDVFTLEYSWDLKDDGTGSVQWHLKRAALLSRMDGTYTLAAPDSVSTQLTYHLTVEPLVPVMGTLRARAENLIVRSAVDELKAYVEQQAEK